MEREAAEGASGANRAGRGVLYLVGTPIGNLEDITLRAVRVLRESPLIACEDTRQTQKLLNHIGSKARTTSFHEHNERLKAPQLIERLKRGESIALVSDAGMPAISDPGYHLIRLCIEGGIAVIPVPGPSAVTAALIASGLPVQPFQFLGFLPARRSQRRKSLQEMELFSGTMVFYESPHRVAETLADVVEILGDRPVAAARELTKLHEEFLRGTCSEVLERLRRRPKIQGEITIVLGGAPPSQPASADSLPLRQRVDFLIEEEGLSRMEALKQAARERGISKRAAYREYDSGAASRA